MSHGAHSSEPRPGWQRWTLALMAVASLVFGAWGNWIYETEQHHDHPHENHPPDVVNVGYHTVQFLILHAPHLHGELPWQLHVGRWLGALTVFTAGFMAFATFFGREMQLLWLRTPLRRKHVVVCGLGDLGLRLALDARTDRRFVVAIEKKGETAAIERAREKGVLVLEGDARDEAVLRKVGLERADFLIVACANDATNVAVAALAGQVLPKTLHRQAPLTCRLLLRDAELRRLLGDRTTLIGGSETKNYRVNVSDLDLQDTAARQALRNNHLDFEPIREQDDTRVHLVVIGFDAMGQALALQAARIGQFANGGKPKCRLRITVVDKRAADRLNEFRGRHHKIDLVCDIASHDAEPMSSATLAFLEGIAKDASSANELVTFGICLEASGQAADRDNLCLGLELGRRSSNFRAQTLIYQSSRRSFAAMFPAEKVSKQVRVYPFGMIEDIYDWDVLLHESEDRLARAVHGYFVNLYGGKPWEELEEHFVGSNRHAADHIPTKLRALGYHDAPLPNDRGRIMDFSDPQVQLLSQMEHRRWCADHWLDNWDHGPVKDTVKRTHPDLVEWDQLTPKEQSKDHAQIKAIPKILEAADRGIYS